MLAYADAASEVKARTKIKIIEEEEEAWQRLASDH
jgi:hypothetical protein